MYQIYSRIIEWLEPLSAFGYYIIILIVVFVSTQAITLSYIYLQLLNRKEIIIPLFKYINIWEIISSNSISNELIYKNYSTVKSKIEFILNISVALSGLLLSVVTCIAYLRRNVAINRKSCITKKEIFETGIDDINIMCNYYTGASFVVVYSHSFEWLNRNDKIRNILIELSKKNKLKLYTDDDINTVKNRLRSSCNELCDCFRQSKISLRCSYVERNNAKYLLYRQEEENHTYVITVQENKESKYLLEVISRLVK